MIDQNGTPPINPIPPIVIARNHYSVVDPSDGARSRSVDKMFHPRSFSRYFGTLVPGIFIQLGPWYVGTGPLVPIHRLMLEIFDLVWS